MDDIRIEWIKKRIYNAFQIPYTEDAFETLLSANNGKAENELLDFLNIPCETEGKSVIFYFEKKEKEVEKEVEYGIFQ